ncbi:hypothetical protein [Leifsonia shinshuensis]|uniref:Uncharacterized protein n=1 Tax=Leifsonia shinshuensis TaxID=150026 RepID=A0A7G6YCM9_9MICO|nr:hypothetical protein [Leifsonia shinshuensis]QNE36244.1 hypothetical protein F1C12_14745 [Leifsonia shinshuensis]
MGGDGRVGGLRPLLLWTGVGVLLVAAFLAALGAVQRAFYSPEGFVSAYVGALASHDLTGALAMPGAAPTKQALAAAGLPANASAELLRSDLLPSYGDTRVLSDTSGPGGRRTVTVRVVADGHPLTAAFEVRQTGAILGLLPTWEFARTPVGVAHITVAHAQTFTVGGRTVSPRAADPSQPASAFSVSAGYLVPAPSLYVLGHSDRYTRAAPVDVAPAPAATVDATVDAQPNDAFTAAVKKELNGFLDECAKQQVLQPAGCPFGVVIDDRVQGVPTWTMKQYPEVHLVPGESSWTMSQAVGIAHLSVTVQSIFDGSVEHRESDEKFAVSLTSVTIRPDGSLDIVVGQ